MQLAEDCHTAITANAIRQTFGDLAEAIDQTAEIKSKQAAVEIKSKQDEEIMNRPFRGHWLQLIALEVRNLASSDSHS